MKKIFATIFFVALMAALACPASAIDWNKTSAGTTITFTPALPLASANASIIFNWGPGETDMTEDFTLLAGSPCIDAADNSGVPTDIDDIDGDADTAEQLDSDLAGNDRIKDDTATADTGIGTAPIVDMGAYEY